LCSSSASFPSLRIRRILSNFVIRTSQHSLKRRAPCIGIALRPLMNCWPDLNESILIFGMYTRIQRDPTWRLVLSERMSHSR
jgi:hypothetical protein